MRVYEPFADENQKQDVLARRSASLDGQLIGLLDNTKDLVSVILGEVKSRLEKDFPGAQFRYIRKESVNGAPPELFEQIATCNAVVSAVGD